VLSLCCIAGGSLTASRDLFDAAACLNFACAGVCADRHVRAPVDVLVGRVFWESDRPRQGSLQARRCDAFSAHTFSQSVAHSSFPYVTRMGKLWIDSTSNLCQWTLSLHSLLLPADEPQDAPEAHRAQLLQECLFDPIHSLRLAIVGLRWLLHCDVCCFCQINQPCSLQLC
jgi:hypothetical protein